MPGTRRCSFCGTAADGPDDGLPGGWSVGVDVRGRTEFLCLDCAREHTPAEL